MKKTVTIEMVSDFDNVMLSQVLQAVGDMLVSGKAAEVGDRRADMMVHRDGSITRGVSKSARAVLSRATWELAGSWKIEP